MLTEFIDIYWAQFCNHRRRVKCIKIAQLASCSVISWFDVMDTGENSGISWTMSMVLSEKWSFSCIKTESISFTNNSILNVSRFGASHSSDASSLCNLFVFRLRLLLSSCGSMSCSVANLDAHSTIDFQCESVSFLISLKSTTQPRKRDIDTERSASTDWRTWETGPIRRKIAWSTNKQRITSNSFTFQFQQPICTSHYTSRSCFRAQST